ncbi:hypothetical protein XO10_07340, partial [Marinitoga sp. 1135]
YYLDYKNGKIYAHPWGPSIFCIDAKTGDILWEYEYENGTSRLGGAPYKIGKYIIDGDTQGYLYVLELLEE